LNENPNLHNEADVSPRLKAAVIGLTVLTCIAGIIFFILFYQRVFSSFGGASWGNRLLAVAEKLENDGLSEQSIQIYQRFLDQNNPNYKTRAQISIKLAILYNHLQNNCADTLSWLYEAEAADPKEFAQNQNAKNLFEICKKRLMGK
tara:strand:+ start:1226 stop:1666 length:441 start_codon:yes stop_codon:yes gene_type:complete